MTTMNHTLNINNTEYVHMTIAVINGEFWDFLLDTSSLTADEVTAVLDCLENGHLDEKYSNPKTDKLIQDTTIRALKALVSLCFDDGKYDHPYTTKLIFDIWNMNL